MKNLLVLIFVAICFAVSASAQNVIAHWGFDETSGTSTSEDISNTTFTIQTKWPAAERVAGVKQKAMRTDGYTVWASGTMPAVLPGNLITFSGWLAPEVYPVTNSALWAQYDEANVQGAWVGMNKFGQLKVEFAINGLLHSYTADSALTHYKWNYIVVSIDAAGGNAKGYINAIKVLDQTFTPGSINWPSSRATIIGKYPKTEMIGLYNSNTMNALVDEVSLYSSILSQAAVTQLYLQDNPSAAPGIKTPSARFAGNHLRPKYHPIPASNWCNESHGFVFHDGLYHMFYQKNGNGGYLFQQNWGHLVSPDLLNWEEVQPALWPQQGWENYGEWSGHIIKDQSGNPVIFYTGVDGIKAGIGKATPLAADLKKWQKSVVNPVIPAAPASIPNKDFRDPYVFKEGANWYMIIGSGLQTPNAGNVFLYKSTDLNNWQFAGNMYNGNNAQYNSGIFWEMPVFWKFGTRYMLLVNKTPENNNPARAFYWLGNFANEVFTPDAAQGQNLELINWLLSPAVNTDNAGRLTAIGIIPDLLPSSEQYKNGYANLFSLPRKWDMQDGKLVQNPHPSLSQLRGDSAVFNSVQVTATGSDFLMTTAGFQKEIKATITADPFTEQAGFIIGKNPSGTEYTKVYYNYYYGEITLDRTHHSLNVNIPGDFRSASFFPDDPFAPVEWRIFIDGSVVEVFINNQYTFSFRMYPSDTLSNKIDLFATGAAVTAEVKAWNITLPVAVSEYVFTGAGNFTDSNNWLNQVMPPANSLPAGKTITIDPAGTGKCILNVPYTIAAGSTIIVKPGKELVLNGNLTVN
jgi:beta-fructofuranosidase